MNLLKWLLFPGVLRIADEGGGGDSSGAQAQADESRKAALRAKIDKLYGISDQKTPIYADGAAPKYFINRPDPANPGSSADDGGPGSRGGTIRSEYTGAVKKGNYAKAFGGGEYATAEDGTPLELDPTTGKVVGYQDDPEAVAAKQQMTGESTQLADATRSYYNDQLARSFGAAERNNRFRLARQGLQGGSEDVDSNANLETDRTLGATRIDDAARRAAAGLDTQREQERVGAIQLVNSGAGESSVASAQAGLRNALNTASSANKANLFGDLFSSGADAYSNLAAQQQAAGMLAQYQKTLGTYFPSSTTSGGRVTPSA